MASMQWLILIGGALTPYHVANARRPSRGRWTTVTSFFDAWITTELAFHWAALIVAWAIGLIVLEGDAVATVPGAVGIVLMLVGAAGYVGLGIEGLRTGDQMRAALAPLRPTSPLTRFPRSHVAVPYLMQHRHNVRRVRDIVFARVAGRELKLDLTLHTETRPGKGHPVVLQIHGGAWIIGDKRQQGQPLLNHLAAQGWVCVNANYRLSPAATFPDHLIDCKLALAWIRDHVADYGGDPGFVCVTGQSAGGHLAALVGLTANHPRYQPGFEHVDTSVRAVVSMYGVYDLTNRLGTWRPEFQRRVLEPWVIKAFLDDEPGLFAEASPIDHVHAGAPPFLVVHGDRDNLVPVDDARLFVERLRAVSPSAVAYAELKGAQHAFELFPSFRAAHVTEGAEQFLQTVVERAQRPRAQSPPPDRHPSLTAPAHLPARLAPAAPWPGAQAPGWTTGWDTSPAAPARTTD
jgi:acetyl esterase/lipase